MITVELTSEQIVQASVLLLKYFRRDLILSSQPDDEKLIEALTLVIDSIDDYKVAQSLG